VRRSKAVPPGLGLTMNLSVLGGAGAVKAFTQFFYFF
jgi:hypothetical protein